MSTEGNTEPVALREADRRSNPKRNYNIMDGRVATPAARLTDESNHFQQVAVPFRFEIRIARLEPVEKYRAKKWL